MGDILIGFFWVYVLMVSLLLLFTSVLWLGSKLGPYPRSFREALRFTCWLIDPW